MTVTTYLSYINLCIVSAPRISYASTLCKLWGVKCCKPQSGKTAELLPPPERHKTSNSTVQYGMVLYGMVWYGMIWYDMAWYGMVWYGTVRYSTV
jgi:hypothetical protein